MPPPISHHRAPPPPPRHTTPRHTTPTHAAPTHTTATHATTPSALVDRTHAATTTPHLDGFDHAPRTPYGVRLGGDEHLTLGSAPSAPDLRARDVPRAPEHTATPHADATPSFMERAIRTFPLVDVIPGFTTFPTGSAGTPGVHDRTSEGDREAGRIESRLDEHGRAPPTLAPPTLPDREREEALHRATESVERGAFCATPAGETSPDCPSH